MFKKLFVVSWLVSSLGMFLLSYLWHGYVLLDFAKNGTPTGLTLFYKIVTYLVIGFVIAKAVNLKLLNKRLLFMPVAKGIIVGIVCGLIVFIIATIKGMSLNVTLYSKYLLLNFFWQVFEQAMGGVIVGVVHNMIFDPDMVPEEQ